MGSGRAGNRLPAQDYSVACFGVLEHRLIDPPLAERSACIDMHGSFARRPFGTEGKPGLAIGPETLRLSPGMPVVIGWPSIWIASRSEFSACTASLYASEPFIMAKMATGMPTRAAKNSAEITGPKDERHRLRPGSRQTWRRSRAGHCGRQETMVEAAVCTLRRRTSGQLGGESFRWPPATGSVAPR